MVSSSLYNKQPLAARSVMSVISGLVCEGKWSQRERGEGSGRPSCMLSRVASHRGSAR